MIILFYFIYMIFEKGKIIGIGNRLDFGGRGRVDYKGVVEVNLSGV